MTQPSNPSYPSEPTRPSPAAMQGAYAPVELPERRGVFAGFANIERDGGWTLPRFFRALAVFGNVELDLTHAVLGPETDMELRCFLGNIEVIVPPGVRLECEGDATIGSFEVKRSGSAPLPPDAPLVRVRAGVILGAIDIRVVDPNAPGLLQRLKAKWKLRDTDPG